MMVRNLRQNVHSLTRAHSLHTQRAAALTNCSKMAAPSQASSLVLLLVISCGASVITVPTSNVKELHCLHYLLAPISYGFKVSTCIQTSTDRVACMRHESTRLIRVLVSNVVKLGKLELP